MIVTRDQRRALARENAKRPTTLVEIPRSEWPNPGAPQLRVLRSRDYLVQVFGAPQPAVARLSICRTEHDGRRWLDGIPWDDLQRLKAEAGFAHLDAVEIYPRACDVVNVANMRHLWVMHAPLSFAWRRAG